MLSLYFDGELPSPWKEKLEAHLKECPRCGDRLVEYKGLSKTLGAALFCLNDGTVLRENHPSEDAAKVRVWQRLCGMDQAVPTAPARFWTRSVPVPLPLVAAFAAALILGFGFFFVKSPVQAVPPDSSLAALNMQTLAPVSDLNGLVQYLGNEDSPDIVIIRLPESRSFISSGEPAIIRAADYRGGKRSQ
jgi:anti-sigma factor RsiW